MALNYALQTPQYTTLRSSYAGEQLISLVSNRVVFAGQINTDLSGGSSWAQFAYNNVTVGSYSAVEVGQALLISATNDIAKASVTFYGRIRKAATSSYIYCNESSQQFSVGAYFWVIDTYLPQFRQSRPSSTDPATAVELVDWEETYQGLLPVVVGLQTAYGGYVDSSTGKLRIAFDVSGSYAAHSGATISSYQFTFTAATYTVVAGALNTAFAIVDFNAGEQWGKCVVTDSGGRSQTRRFVIKAHDYASNAPDLGFEGAQIQGQLDQGYSMTIPAFAGVNSVLNNTMALTWRNNEIYGGTSQRLWGGGSATVTAKSKTSNIVTLTAANNFQAGQRVVVAISDSRFDGTFTILSATSTQFTYQYSGTNVSSTGASGLAHVNANNIDFVGWLQRESDPITADAQASVITGATFTFTGVGLRMQRLTAERVAITQSASPSVWGEIASLTPWRGICHYLSRYTTVANLCDIGFDETTNAWQFPAFPVQGGSVMSGINSICQMINAFIEIAPAGQMYIARGAAYQNTFQRGSLTTVGNWTSEDALEINRDYEPNAGIGKLDADGAFYNTSSGQVTVYTARAPGTAQGDAAGTATLTSQILLATTDPIAALDELRFRAGCELLILNNNETLDVLHPDAFCSVPLIPSRTLLYTWTLDTSVGGSGAVNRVIYDTTTSWVCESISLQQGSNGERQVRARYRVLTPPGDLGYNTTQNIPAPGEVPTVPDPGLPAFDFETPETSIPDSGITTSQVPPDPVGRVAWFNGQEMLAASTTQVFWLKNFITLTTPTATEITPPDLGSYTIRSIAIDPFYTNNAIGAYLLASDGTNSAVWYNPNVAAPGASANWTKGADVNDVYTVLRPTSVAGSVAIYGTGNGAWTQTFDFTTSNGGFSTRPVTVGTPGTWVNGTGWVAGDVQSPAGNYYRAVFIGISFSASTITGLSATYDMTAGGTDAGSGNDFIEFGNGVTVLQNQTFASQVSGTDISFSWTGSSAGVTTLTLIIASSYYALSATYAGAVTLKSITVSGTGTNPFSGGGGGGSGTPNVRISTDYGATFGSALTLGSAFGTVGGFDVQRAGTVSYAASAGAVYKATTIGGSYSSWYSVPSSANPISIIIPYYKRNSSTVNTSTSTPDAVIGCDNGKWYWIDGATASATDITPVANLICYSPDALTVRWGNLLACWGAVSGGQKLYTSSNGGSSWTLRGSISNAGKIRCRRNDMRLSPSGQLYLAQNNVIDYSSRWAAGGGADAGMFPRYMPATGIVMFDTVF